MSTFSDLKIEPEYAEPYQTWASDRSPANNALLLKTLQPEIDKAVKSQIPKPNPLIRGKAKLLALQGMATYDPKKSRVRTHLYNHMQGLQRYAGKQSQALKIPERVVLDRRTLDNTVTELEDELGRYPSDAELSRATGFSMKRIGRVREANTGMSVGQMDAGSPDGFSPGVKDNNDMWLRIVYSELSPIDQQIMAASTGFNGTKRLSNQELAARLKRSPSAISQRKAMIQQLIQKEADISLF